MKTNPPTKRLHTPLRLSKFPLLLALSLLWGLSACKSVQNTLAKPKPTYSPVANARSETGWGVHYGAQDQGRTTASGEPYDHRARTASHRSLPFGQMVQVTNLDNGRSTVVRINDRPSVKDDKLIGVSGAAAQDLDLFDKGLARVQVIPVQEGFGTTATPVLATVSPLTTYNSPYATAPYDNRATTTTDRSYTRPSETVTPPAPTYTPYANPAPATYPSTAGRTSADPRYNATPASNPPNTYTTAYSTDSGATQQNKSFSGNPPQTSVWRPQAPVTASVSYPKPEISGRYTIQLYVLTNTKNIREVQESFPNEVWVETLSEGGQTQYRLNHGQYATKREAEQALLTVKQKLERAYIRPIR